MQCKCVRPGPTFSARTTTLLIVVHAGCCGCCLVGMVPLALTSRLIALVLAMVISTRIVATNLNFNVVTAQLMLSDEHYVYVAPNATARFQDRIATSGKHVKARSAPSRVQACTIAQELAGKASASLLGLPALDSHPDRAPGLVAVLDISSARLLRHKVKVTSGALLTFSPRHYRGA